MLVPSAAPGWTSAIVDAALEDVAAVERLVETLGLVLVEEGRGLDLRHEHEDRVGLAPGELGHLGRLVDLVGLDLDVEADVDARLLEGGDVGLPAAGAELVVLVDDVDRLHALLDHEADELVRRRVDAEGRAVDVVVVTVLFAIGDRGRLRPHEHRYLGPLGLDHVHDGAGGEHGAEEDEGVVLGLVGHHLPGDVGIALGVLRVELDLASEDAAVVVDLGHGHLDAEPPVLSRWLVRLVGHRHQHRVPIGALAGFLAGAAVAGSRIIAVVVAATPGGEERAGGQQRQQPRPARTFGHSVSPLGYGAPRRCRCPEATPN